MTEHKEVFDIIKEVSTQYKFKFPKVGIIPDKNPTAFTYGSARYNARIVLTEGIFHFLNPQETRAVVAHELGHIVRRDFIIMMIATTLIQILYEIYANFSKTKNKKGDALKLLSIIAHVLYVIGIYLMYYLSRTREYLADQFSTQYSRPEDLSNALIKIAYGIVSVDDDNNSKKLLESTRHLGILDVQKAKYYGIASLVSDSNPDLISEVMVFDKVSPWAFFIELGSTHPLTGKRIQHLKEIANQRGESFPYDVDRAQNRMNIDKSRLYREFVIGACFAIISLSIPIISLFTLPLVYIPAAFGIAFIIRLIYRYPIRKNEKTTIIDEMRNPYASPLRGRNISLEGRVIGRGIPGYIFEEDTMF
jgi:Zn-dependent protease with chaperone function